jgi:hypothetical protein
MLDICEAIKTLDAYSTLIKSETGLCEKWSNGGAPDGAKEVFEDFVKALEAQTKESQIIAILVTQEVTRRAEQLVVGYPGELAELMTALNRNHEATGEARKFVLAHREKTKVRDPGESISAKAIAEFKKRHLLPN